MSEGKRSSGLARVPTSSIVRSLLMSTFFTSPILFRSGFTILKRIATSRSRFLNPDINPILRVLIKPLIYDQFCAGRTRAEILRTRESIKSMGFAGVILCYGKEIVVPSNADGSAKAKPVEVDEALEVEQWKRGNLQTLDMIGQGDWLGLKFTGAGSQVTKALAAESRPSPHLVRAMNEICQRAAAQGCRVWIDSEQHILQPTIDRWAVEFMKRHNTGNKVVVYNTVQAYLKNSRDKIKQQMELAHRENWGLGIKLVRGAYIDSDPRQVIHDTKQETDDSYNGIVRDLLTGSGFGVSKDQRSRTQLFLAGHNPDSVSKALEWIESLKGQGQLQIMPDFGQLQGMADKLGCDVIEHGQSLGGDSSRISSPKVFKCLTWGSIQECLQYLVRRVVENSGGADRIRDGRTAFVQELKRRFLWS